MPSLIILLMTATGLGIAYCGAPGAVNTEAIRRGLAHGGRSALLVEAGSLIGDALWALLALTGVALLAHHWAAQVVLGIAGGLFLLRMAWSALHDAWLGARAPSSSRQARGDFATGAFFGLANPFGLAFWSGMGSGAVALGVTGIGYALFFAGFFLGAVLWCVALSALLGWGRRWVRPGLFRAVNALCGLALGYFGLRLLWGVCADVLDRLALGAAQLIEPAR
jgi:chemosensory pili system protein ChpE